MVTGPPHPSTFPAIIATIIARPISKTASPGRVRTFVTFPYGLMLSELTFISIAYNYYLSI